MRALLAEKTQWGHVRTRAETPFPQTTLCCSVQLPDESPIEENAPGIEARLAQEEGKGGPLPIAEVEEGESAEKMRMRIPDHAAPAIVEEIERALGTSSKFASARGSSTASVETVAILLILRCTMSKSARQRIVRMPAMVQKPPRSVGLKITEALRPGGLRTAKRSMDRKASRRRASALVGGEEAFSLL